MNSLERSTINRYHIPFESKTHRRDVKRAQGTACYGALVQHFKTDSAKRLELLVDGREPYGTEEPSVSNKFLRWRQGKALPNETSVKHVEKVTDGKVKLDYWRDLPLWALLRADPPSIPWIHRQLECTGLAVRRILFLDGVSDRLGFIHSLPDRSETLAIRNLRTLEAFLALLAMARKGEVLEDDPYQHLPAAAAFDILPYVLFSNPPLLYRWECLFLCLHRIFWNRVTSTGAIFMFPEETVRSGLAKLKKDPTADLKPMAGHW